MIDFKFFLIEQPVGKLYLGALGANYIDSIAKPNTRSAFNQDGVQRNIIYKRVKEIADYAKNDDAIFPTPIILSAKSKYIDFSDIKQNILKINNDAIDSNKDFFNIIDGQHRLAGIKESGKLDEFTLPVVLILDSTLEQDAEIFVTINGNQRPVSKSLIYDLFGLSTSRTVEKTCHTIIKSLNRDDDSKIKHKIKMLGYCDEESRYGTVSQATMVGSLIKLITNNTNKDNKCIKDNIELDSLDSNKYIFREYFISKDDAVIYKILKNYFNAWTLAKESLKDGNEWIFLEKSIGYMASFYLLRAIFLKGKIDGQATEQYYTENLSKILADFEKKDSKGYSSSESGAKELFKDLVNSAIDSGIFDESFISNYGKSLGVKDINDWFEKYNKDIL